MPSKQSAVWRFLFVMMIGSVWVSAIANESEPKQTPKPDTVQEKESDIWKEFSFASEEDQQLTEKQIREILDQLKKTDPQKAKALEELQNVNTEKFIAAIRDEIRMHKKPVSEQPKKEDWKEELYKKHEVFLDWFKKEYPRDHKELIELQVEEPEKYVQRFMDLVQIYEPIQRTEKYNPKLADTMKKNLELQKQRDALLLQIRIAPENQQPKLIELLKSVVSQRFDTIVLEKQLQYEWLQERLEDLKQRLEERGAELKSLNENKEQSVQSRMDELLERTEKVNWD